MRGLTLLSGGKQMKSNMIEIAAQRENVKTGLDAAARRKLAALLTECLADTMVLMLKSQVFHWNVVGPIFFDLHKLTEEHYKNMFEAADELAERVRALGSLIPLDAHKMAKASILGEELSLRTTEEMLEQLITDHEAVVRNMRNTALEAQDLGDVVSSDLLVRRMSFHEKAIWMLRAIAAN
jgi:starvation-inducible DNA-binding protein